MSFLKYRSYPDTLNIREFKEADVIYVTTFLDSKKYAKKELRLLYKRRWEVETNLNFIKTVMEMNRLTCKTPAMVEKEIGIHFLAYNMIRNLMVKASVKHKLHPTQISFKGTIQLLNQFTPLFHNVNKQEKIILCEYLLDYIAKNKVGNRPGRVEPGTISSCTTPGKVTKDNCSNNFTAIVAYSTPGSCDCLCYPNSLLNTK